MNRRELRRLESELSEYVDSLFGGLGRVERRTALRLYVLGLLLDGERKSIEPMGARLVDDASEIQSMRQRLQQAVCVAKWRDELLFERLAKKLDQELPGVEAFVIDDTGFPKKGEHSVGVQRQYSGTLGRIDNCQVAVSLHLAGENGSGAIAFRLFLPESWTHDSARRAATGVPEETTFETKPQLALKQLDWALEAGIRRHVVLADAGYGDSLEFRRQLVARGLQYVVGINGEPTVWPPGSSPRPPAQVPGKRGPRPTRFRDEKHPAQRVKQLASTLTYRRVSWREGARGWQSSRFAAVRIRTAHRPHHGNAPGEEQWLLCEWPLNKETPCKYWLSNLPASTSVRALVRLAKLRWRVERDYQEMKQEVGLDHFEGRGWIGFHHHAALCAVAHGFLALKRALFPPAEMPLDASAGPPSTSTSPTAADRDLPSLPQAN